jgi:hypothetical protein
MGWMRYSATYNFVAKTRLPTSANKNPSNGCTLSTIHRWDFCRASYLPRFDDKMAISYLTKKSLSLQKIVEI